jgi:hypothetical protein
MWFSFVDRGETSILIDIQPGSLHFISQKYNSILITTMQTFVSSIATSQVSSCRRLVIVGATHPRTCPSDRNTLDVVIRLCIIMYTLSSWPEHSLCALHWVLNSSQLHFFSYRVFLFCAEHKATKLMNHRRPKKTNPSDKRHKPAEYAPLPPPPPEFTVVSSK